ncbi:MAG: transcriptional repressor [Anaerolineales bacterium]|nr:transcriptional repressor [Anaerolineales bacterium]
MTTHPIPIDSQEPVAQSLRQAGLRPTPQRLSVYRYLKATASHPTAQQVYEALAPEHPALSLATVYNTLETLVGLGLINALGAAGDDAVHYDGDTRPHINLACMQCHRVIDLQSESVSALQAEVSAHSGYLLLGARVLYYGVCPACQVIRDE